MKLVENKGKLERELRDAHKVASASAHELLGLREQARMAATRITALRDALGRLRGEALVVSLGEYAQMRTLLEENEGIVAKYEGLAAAVKLKGTAAASRAEAITQGLADVDQELKACGVLLQFPTPPRMSTPPEVPEDEGPDDDDDDDDD
jgi:hypothetical protein